VIYPPIKIAITGTHSSGKTTFLERLTEAISRPGLRIHRIGDLARKAQDRGFPILKDHTFESTLWIVAECMRCEAEASLDNDVILVDRPVVDALGYLHAALRVSGRRLDSRRLEELTTIVTAHTPDYDVLVMTALNKAVDLGEGRDRDADFREAAADEIERLVSGITKDALILGSDNKDDIVQSVADMVASRLTARNRQ
jgi:predicted ATPase